MSLWTARMPYLVQSRHGIFKYRRAIPEPLRRQAGKREIVDSLGTKDAQEAELRSARVHLEAETWLRALKATATRPSEATKEAANQELSAIEAWFRGMEFLKGLGLRYVPYQGRDDPA